MVRAAGARDRPRQSRVTDGSLQFYDQKLVVDRNKKPKVATTLTNCVVCDDAITTLDDYQIYAAGHAHCDCVQFVRLQRKLLLDSGLDAVEDG